MISDNYKKVLSEKNQIIKQQNETERVKLEENKVNTMTSALTEVKTQIKAYKTIECNYDEVDATNKKMDDMKTKTAALNEKFSTILNGLKSYCKNAKEKNESYTVINQESNTQKKTPIKY